MSFWDIGRWIISVVALFWVSIAFDQIGIPIPFLRPVLGILIFTLFPGILLALSLDIRPSTPAFSGNSEPVSLGEFLLFSVGMSLVVVSVLTVAAGLVLPVAGVSTPLSTLPFAALVTGTILILLLLTYYSGSSPVYSQVSIDDISPAFLVYFILPALAVLAAEMMNRFNSNILMYIFVLVTVGAVILIPTNYVPRILYPSAIFSISISTMFHRNLITPYVLGADIQFIYFVADMIKQAQIWTPNLGGELIALPIVTSFPATLSAVTALELSLVFKVVFVLIFSFMPVGIFYIFRYIFDDRVAVFGSLLFLFYHVTFYFTPDKQLIAGMFVVLLLLVVIKYQSEHITSKITTAIVIIGIAFSHHGVAYVFGFSLLGSTILVWFVGKYYLGMDTYFSYYHSLGLLSAATLWYGFASPELLLRVIGAPVDALSEIGYLLTGEISQVGGSGESFISQLSLSPEIGTLVVYFAITALLLLGISWKSIYLLTQHPINRSKAQVSLTALGLPLSAFLVSSYFLPISLWADRVYQMVLPVLCPFMAIGYYAIATVSKRYRVRLPSGKAVLSLLVCLLFLFNSGFVFSLAGSPTDPTFSSDAHDLAFTEAEYESSLWLKNHEDIHRVDYREAFPSVTTPNTTSSNEVRIYIDQYTYQIFRSTIPSEYFNIQYIYTKSEWRSNVTGEDISSGYVVVRDNSIVNAGEASELPSHYLTVGEAENISKSGDLIFTNEDISIYSFNKST